jgi:hypothetical protein
MDQIHADRVKFTQKTPSGVLLGLSARPMNGADILDVLNEHPCARHFQNFRSMPAAGI